jgi:hypothetical protein
VCVAASLVLAVEGLSRRRVISVFFRCAQLSDSFVWSNIKLANDKGFSKMYVSIHKWKQVCLGSG